MWLAHMTGSAFPDAADVQQFASLTQLTHLDLGHAHGVAALTSRLPNLQSLALVLYTHFVAASDRVRVQTVCIPRDSNRMWLVNSNRAGK